MIASPRRTASTSAIPAIHPWADVDDMEDDDGWQDMPVVRSDDNPFDLDEEDQKKYHYRPPARLDSIDPTITGAAGGGGGGGGGNATGTHMELDVDTLASDSWREKVTQDESDYTRIRLDEDNESEEVHMRTKYLFNEDKAMTPLSQMQATKELLTEGQRIAYVGLCQLVARGMLRDMARGWEGIKVKNKVVGLTKGKGKDNELPVVESGHIWMLKIMARLYQHMEVERDEQRMIESLAEHGVDPSDLVPALMTTHTVKNPEFDPQAKKEADIQAAADKEAEGDAEVQREILEENAEMDPPPPYVSSSPPVTTIPKTVNPFGDDEDELKPYTPTSSSSSKPTSTYPIDDDEGDIASVLSPSVDSSPAEPSDEAVSSHTSTPKEDPEMTPKAQPSQPSQPVPDFDDDPNTQTTLPSLPGVSTSLSNTDELVTLDIRWTVLCDLFLVLIADSVYDARSRVFLERVASALGFGWLDVVRFENRVTEALEIREGLEKTDQDAIIEGRRKQARNKRYAMMGLAAVGGGLVIGLSAGLMAPLIGAGLGTAFATVGITGTGTFLAGAGGAAVITTGGVLTGANIAGKGMARRTREVRTFEFRPLHNNKHVSCYITVGGFMASKFDDVRLPFSVLDPIVGDVFSVYWEPEMMAEMGGALKILTSEILTQVGQSVLQATVMAALMSALQWPIILTKLGYLIDNPWSNALDRSRAAGLLLADTIIHRHAGVRPISLIGFSLGARAIFYALIELARVKAYGLVQDVFIFGTTVTASRTTWLDVRSVVSGRFVNGFATNDWMLGYLFRATSGGLNTVAGLRAVETVPGLENVDVTEIIAGHMSYRSCMPQLLALVGFPVTADFFDEPEDPDTDMSVQERTVVREEEEEKRNRRKILGIFPARKGSKSSPSGSGSGSTTPSTVVIDEKYEYDDGDDDLPPREEGGDDDGDLGSTHIERDEEERERARIQREKEKEKEEEEKAIKSIPKTAGFDFKAISRELGKEIDVDKLRAPTATRPGQRPGQGNESIHLNFGSIVTDKESAASGSGNGGRIALERSGSAPPPESTTKRAIAFSPTPIQDNVNSNSTWSSSANVSAGASTSRNLSIPRFNNDDDDDETGDITASTSRMSLGSGTAGGGDIPNWDRSLSAGNVFPSARESTSSNTSGSGSGDRSNSTFSWNAWSTTSTSTSKPLRAAPPARPHPAEFVNMNPFSSALGVGGMDAWSSGKVDFGGGGKGESSAAVAGLTKEEQEAETNPW